MTESTLVRVVTERRKQILSAGYTPIPVNGKVPPEGWTEKTATTNSEIELWPDQYPRAGNTGLLTRQMPTLDIDIKNQKAAEAVEALIRKRFWQRGRILVRIGQAPKRAVPFRTDMPFKKITMNFLAPDASTGQKLELLGDGQQVVAFGTHPLTRKPYEWSGGEPGDVKLEQLPIITEAEAQQLVDDAAKLLDAFGYQPTAARPKGDAAEGGEDWAYLLENIHAGHELHDSTRDLAAKLIVSGMNAGAAVNLLRAEMQQSTAPHDARFRERLDDIPNLVTSAEEKFGGVDNDASTQPITATPYEWRDPAKNSAA